MKKSCFVCIVASLVFASCATGKGAETGDYGVYPKDAPQEELCNVVIDKNVSVLKFDNNAVEWDVFNTPKTVKVKAGLHTFYAWYSDDAKVSVKSMPVICELQKGNTYLLKGIVSGRRIRYQMVLYNDEKEGDDVTLDLDKLQGNASGVLSNYIKYVLNPTMKEVGNTVKLENEKYILTFKPEMVYTLQDKKSGKTSEGRSGFNMDFRMTEGQVFLLETDISKMSDEDFLKSDYTKNAQTILVPVTCTANTLVYKYEKPENLAGTEISFSISEIKKK